MHFSNIETTHGDYRISCYEKSIPENVTIRENIMKYKFMPRVAIDCLDHVETIWTLEATSIA